MDGNHGRNDMHVYNLTDVQRAFDGHVSEQDVKEFFYHDTDAVGLDMARALANAVLAGREVAIFVHDGLTIAHLGGGSYVVNERSTGVGDSSFFQSDSHEEAKFDALDVWRG